VQRFLFALLSAGMAHPDMSGMQVFSFAQDDSI
jgi:hypothetical protein